METVRAIVLHAFPLRDRDEIVRLFSRELGRLSLIAKRKKGEALLLRPLSEGEFIFKRGKGELHRLIDGSLLNGHLDLRKNFATLKAAGELLSTILLSQHDEKPAPSLFDLFAAYLAHLPVSANPSLLVASFKLKVLKHEGLIAKTPVPPFSQKEWSALQSLIESRSFSALYQTENSCDLPQIAHHLFDLCITHA